jgi:hypothetical protein
MNLERLYSSVLDLQKQGNYILSKYESSTSRIITIDSSYERLNKLSLRQEELFREAFKCIEHRLYRSSHVLAWASFIDFLGEKLGEDGFKNLNTIKKWNIFNTDDLREHASDSVIIDCAEQVGLTKKHTTKSLKGLLAKRNECGHPSDYKPGLNDTLGYIDELLKRIELLQKT